VRLGIARGLLLPEVEDGLARGSAEMGLVWATYLSLSACAMRATRPLLTRRIAGAGEGVRPSSPRDGGCGGMTATAAIELQLPVLR
jgi:hypothetical protein